MKGYDPTDLHSMQEDKREEDARKRLARDVEIADLRWLMSSKNGRRFMNRLFSLTGVYRHSFDTNAMKMAFNEGNRNMGLMLLNEVMEHCPEMRPVMEKEFRNARDGDGKQSK